MPPSDELDALRALRLPPGSAPFWSDVALAVAVGLVFALAVAVAIRLLARPRASLRAEAVQAYDAALALPPAERRAAQAALLRRIVRSVEGEDAARSSGETWAQTLDRVFRTDLFAARAGRVFVDGLYDRSAARDDPALDAALAALLRGLRG